LETFTIFLGFGSFVHPDKCSVLTITNKKHPVKHNYLLHNHTLKSVSSAKYLGITLQSDLKWTQHTNNIVVNANKSLGFLKRNLKTSNTNIKSQAYLSLVRPKLKYACSVWNPHTAEHCNTIEMVQRRAARYACNRYHNTSSVTDMLQTLTITTTSTQNKTYYVLQDCSPYSCGSYNNINTNRPKNQTISSIYIQTSSCIQRSVQVLILSEHNHSLEFTTSNYSSMPNSQHV
jgi:hypothetical protein